MARPRWFCAACESIECKQGGPQFAKLCGVSALAVGVNTIVQYKCLISTVFLVPDTLPPLPCWSQAILREWGPARCKYLSFLFANEHVRSVLTSFQCSCFPSVRIAQQWCSLIDVSQPELLPQDAQRPSEKQVSCACISSPLSGHGLDGFAQHVNLMSAKKVDYSLQNCFGSLPLQLVLTQFGDH